MFLGGIASPTHIADRSNLVCEARCGTNVLIRTRTDENKIAKSTSPGLSHMTLFAG